LAVNVFVIHELEKKHSETKVIPTYHSPLCCVIVAVQTSLCASIIQMIIETL